MCSKTGISFMIVLMGCALAGLPCFSWAQGPAIPATSGNEKLQWVLDRLQGKDVHRLDTLSRGEYDPDLYTVDVWTDPPGSVLTREVPTLEFLYPDLGIPPMPPPGTPEHREWLLALPIGPPPAEQPASQETESDRGDSLGHTIGIPYTEEELELLSTGLRKYRGRILIIDDRHLHPAELSEKILESSRPVQTPFISQLRHTPILDRLMCPPPASAIDAESEPQIHRVPAEPHEPTGICQKFGPGCLCDSDGEPWYTLE